ncbi:NUDIX hydrolase [Mesotoga sp. H07.pep.5.3]|jgi:ADP-ribose pyrophosphatase|uniref:NUDIX hydrolase n=1 Tax=Mesotoga sp. H07.pep.5.3 TaxID=1421003 RepID=UPI000C18E990|nr:NUDIX hydrolase [Mesotoga sp. H07.pep.5.3]MDK2943744.1 ADP-ribose pyrophosphatase [Mesotoga sp.]PIJ61897.1 ADP-ribose pyrophosphatase [Mesotoga sp. H07.pep.5.3]
MERSVGEERIFSGRILGLERHTVILQDGSVALREVVRHPGAVAIVAFVSEQLLLVRQFRFPVQKYMLEIPAGKLDAGERPEDCARRELLEETGYVPRFLHKLITIETSPGFSDEIIHIYVAEVEKSQEPCPDEGEFVEPVLIDSKEVLDMIIGGQITDSKTVSGILLAFAGRESDKYD